VTKDKLEGGAKDSDDGGGEVKCGKVDDNGGAVV